MQYPLLEKYISNKDAYISSVGDFHEGLALVTEEEVIYYDEGSVQFNADIRFRILVKVVLDFSVTGMIFLSIYKEFRRFVS